MWKGVAGVRRILCMCVRRSGAMGVSHAHIHCNMHCNVLVMDGASYTTARLWSALLWSAFHQFAFEARQSWQESGCHAGRQLQL